MIKNIFWPGPVLDQIAASGDCILLLKIRPLLRPKNGHVAMCSYIISNDTELDLQAAREWTAPQDRWAASHLRPRHAKTSTCRGAPCRPWPIQLPLEKDLALHRATPQYAQHVVLHLAEKVHLRPSGMVVCFAPSKQIHADHLCWCSGKLILSEVWIVTRKDMDHNVWCPRQTPSHPSIPW